MTVSRQFSKGSPPPTDRVQASFQSWVDDFRFSSDIRELEEFRQRRSNTDRPQPQWRPFPQSTVTNPDEAAEVLLPFDDVDAELFQDNRLMARQIEQLLKENRQLQFELECRDAELASFRKLLGGLYLKP